MASAPLLYAHPIPVPDSGYRISDEMETEVSDQVIKQLVDQGFTRGK